MGDVFGLQLSLMIGPTERDWYSEAQLRRGWRVYGEQLTGEMCRHDRPGVRPWGWWRFVAGREEPDDFAERLGLLAELGELTIDERSRLAEQ